MQLLFQKGPYDPIFNINGKTDYGNLYTKLVCWWMNSKFLFREANFNYMIFYIIISVTGFQASEIVYSLHLLDVIVNS